MTHKKIHSCPELTAAVDQLGFLPLLKMGIRLSAEELTAEECQYTVLPDGGWEWPLWEWKGSVLRESGCAYGKFFDRKATFISSEWWPHFCNWRRSRYPEPEEGSIEQMVLSTLQEHGSLITRELRALCIIHKTKCFKSLKRKINQLKTKRIKKAVSTQGKNV